MQVSLIGGLLVIASQGAGTLGGVYLKYISPGKNAIWLGAAQTLTGGGILIFIGLLGGGSLHATDLVQGAGSDGCRYLYVLPGVDSFQSAVQIQQYQ